MASGSQSVENDDGDDDGKYIAYWRWHITKCDKKEIVQIAHQSSYEDSRKY